jgi:hypothetical protein
MFARKLLRDGVSQFIGDSLSVSASAVYSVRRFYSNYLGSLMTVRRSSDNEVRGIGSISNGDLNIPDLIDFVGVGNGFAATWLDQSGNSRNLPQPTTAIQPQIVTSGVVNLVNGRPAIRFNGTSTSLVNGSVGLPIGANPRTMNVVYKPETTLGTNSICGQGSTGGVGNWFLLQNRASPSGNPYFAGFNQDVTDNQSPTLAAKVASVTFDSTTVTLFRDGTQFASNARSLNTTGDFFRVGISPNAIEWGNLFVQEITFFPSVLSGNDRQLLERNQGAYFGITVI